MGEVDRTKWDRKYASPDLVTGNGPKPFLLEMADRLPTAGPALDVACGEGQTAVWLATRGLDVDGIDVSPVGLAKATQLAEDAGVLDRVHLFEHDLDRGLPDLRGPYDLVTCLHFHAPDLMPPLRELLAPGGLLVVEVLTRENLSLGPPCPPERFLAATDAVLEFATGLEVLLHEEGCFAARPSARATARLVARRQSP